MRRFPRWPLLRSLLFVAAALAAGCRGVPVRLDLAPPQTLPARVLFRTDTESFNRQYFVALRDGRIWVKPNSETRPDAVGAWHLLGETGLPEGDDLVRFPPPERVVAISADGVHLHAVSDAGVLYRGDNLTSESHVEGWFNWTDRWGWPAARGDGLTIEWPLARGWSVSDSHPFGVDHYEDPNGTEHGVGMGVAHVYRLGPDGRAIHFNDWWLPSDWSRQVCGPARGTFEAVNLSASASTLLLVGPRGALWTRLYDFDTAGENDLLTYSYVIDGDDGTTRKLPPDPWRLQPTIDGRITRRITIFQDGEGNAARVLRVQGVRAGQGGYFEKHIFDEAWRFVATDDPIDEPLLGAEAPDAEERPPADVALVGTLSNGDATLGIEVTDFNPICSPARARLTFDGRVLTVDGASLELALHHAHGMVKERRATHYWEQGGEAKIRTALLLPDAVRRVDDEAARRRIEELFGDRAAVNSAGGASPSGMDVEEIPWTTPFLVPAREKPMFGRIRMVLKPKP